LFAREPDARLPQVEAAGKVAAGKVFIEAERVARFLSHLEAEGRTGRYRQNVRTYLAQWAEALPGEGIVSGVTFP